MIADGSNGQKRAADSGDRPVLIVQGGAESGSIIILSLSRTTLGRQPDNDVVLDEVAVSRYHAEILATASAHRIRALGSRNGTQVNRQRIEKGEHVLKQGDIIHLGGSNVSFRFQRAGTRTVSLSAIEPASGVVVVDPKARQVYVRDQRLDPPMSRKEFDLLMLLDSKRGEAINRDEIAASVWAEREDGDVGNHEIEQCVRRVRVRIEDDPSRPQFLVTVRGFGYKLN
ncbi:MAG: FHA domain-containing protein [Chloroflexi bacterium]|nr:FHA domain-containing protein [Chloroflexota bacterium]